MGLDEPLVCQINKESLDPNGDSVMANFHELNGDLYEGDTETTVHTGDTIAQEELEYGQEWICRVVPSDGMKWNRCSRDGCCSNQW